LSQQRNKSVTIQVTKFLRHYLIT